MAAVHVSLKVEKLRIIIDIGVSVLFFKDVFSCLDEKDCPPPTPIPLQASCTLTLGPQLSLIDSFFLSYITNL